MWVTSKCLALLLMLMFKKRREASSMKRVSHMYLLVMIQNPKVTNCMIHTRRRLSCVKMYNSIKRIMELQQWRNLQELNHTCWWRSKIVNDLATNVLASPPSSPSIASFTSSSSSSSSSSRKPKKFKTLHEFNVIIKNHNDLALFC